MPEASKKRKRAAAPVVDAPTPAPTLPAPAASSGDESGDGAADATFVTARETASSSPAPEVEVLSRKAARKRRKLEDKAQAAPAEGTKPAAAQKKGEHGVWVGNMSFRTSQDMLRDFFSNRACEEIVRINMPGGKRPGELNRGCVALRGRCLCLRLSLSSARR